MMHFCRPRGVQMGFTWQRCLRVNLAAHPVAHLTTRLMAGQQIKDITMAYWVKVQAMEQMSLELSFAMEHSRWQWLQQQALHAWADLALFRLVSLAHLELPLECRWHTPSGQQTGRPGRRHQLQRIWHLLYSMTTSMISCGSKCICRPFLTRLITFYDGHCASCMQMANLFCNQSPSHVEVLIPPCR